VVFDRFLDEQGMTEPRITRAITGARQQSLRHLDPRTQGNRCGTSAQVSEIMNLKTTDSAFFPGAIGTI
jgi:hypothetical protein